MESACNVRNNALEKAPTHMNPACPRLSSPEKPTTRFRETAMQWYKHKGEQEVLHKKSGKISSSGKDLYDHKNAQLQFHS